MRVRRRGVLQRGRAPSGHGVRRRGIATLGHDAVVRLLVERGARLDIRDTIYQSTPLGWAEYGGRTEIAEYPRAQGGKTGKEIGQ